jgi:ParB-like chromosome segregation protein Spo0J
MPKPAALPRDATWRSRIVESADVDPATLVANPHNWRTHPPNQRAAINGVLSDVGWVARILVNRTTGRMIDGHLRVEEAIRVKAATVPVDFVELDEREEAIVLATLDPIGAMAQTERTKLDEVIRAAQTTDADVQRCIAELAEREKLYLGAGANEPEDRAPAPAIKAALAIPPRVWLTMRDDLVRAIEEAAAGFGVSVKWAS